MRVAIHQPHYLPYPGYIHKLMNSDTFVFLDTCDMKRSTGKENHENRNRIKTPNGVKWLTAPIGQEKKSGCRFVDAHVIYDGWRESHRRKIEAAYRDAPFHDETMKFLRTLWQNEHTTMAMLGKACVFYLSYLLDMDPYFTSSSAMDLDPDMKGTESLVEICRQLGATEYISGQGAQGYLKTELFEKAGIEVVWQEYEPIVYQQMHGDFEPNLSIIDAMFNIGVKQTAIAIKGA